MLSITPRDYSLIAPYYDKIFNKFLSEGHREIGRLLKPHRKTKDFKVLEVGVGSGLTFSQLPDNMDFFGIDISEEMLSLASEKAERLEQKKIRLNKMDAHDLKFEDESFDLVFASSVLSAVNDPEEVMNEMIRVTKHNGQIAVIMNVRDDSFSSKIIKSFDPVAKKFLGFRTDMNADFVHQYENIEILDCREINNVLGFPLSTYYLFKKI